MLHVENVSAANEVRSLREPAEVYEQRHHVFQNVPAEKTQK